MSQISIFGPIHLYGKDYLPVYKELNSVAEDYFDDVIGTYPEFWETEESPKQFYQRSIETVENTDLLVAEVTEPSHGLGMEMQVAAYREIPLLALAKKDQDVSSMVKGNPSLQKIIRYSNQEELVRKFEQEIQKITDSSRN